jgi:hypothetical protein
VFPDVPDVPPLVLPDVPEVPPDVLPEVPLVPQPGPPLVQPEVPLVPPPEVPDVPDVSPLVPDVPDVPDVVAACPWMSAHTAHASTLQFSFGRPLAVAVQPPPDPGTPWAAGIGFETWRAVRGSELLPGLIAAPPPIAFLPLGQFAVAVRVTVLVVLTAFTYSTECT